MLTILKYTRPQEIKLLQPITTTAPASSNPYTAPIGLAFEAGKTLGDNSNEISYMLKDYWDKITQGGRTITHAIADPLLQELGIIDRPRILISNPVAQYLYNQQLNNRYSSGTEGGTVYPEYKIKVDPQIPDILKTPILTTKQSLPTEVVPTPRIVDPIVEQRTREAINKYIAQEEALQEINRRASIMNPSINITASLPEYLYGPNIMQNSTTIAYDDEGNIIGYADEQEDVNEDNLEYHPVPGPENEPEDEPEDEPENNSNPNKDPKDNPLKKLKESYNKYSHGKGAWAKPFSYTSSPGRIMGGIVRDMLYTSPITGLLGIGASSIKKIPDAWTWGSSLFDGKNDNDTIGYLPDGTPILKDIPIQTENNKSLSSDTVSSKEAEIDLERLKEIINQSKNDTTSNQ